MLLPRKEVIQPHLPVRLPCYDFTPLALHTFDASPLAVGPAASGADDSGGVTGGVYKARERIHRGMLIREHADPRLLATPTSRGRVAAPDPNWGRLSGSAPPRGVASLCTGHCSTCAAQRIRGMMT